MKLSIVVDGQVSYEETRVICDECVEMRDMARVMLWSHYLEHVADNRPLSDVVGDQIQNYDELARDYMRILMMAQRGKKNRISTDVEHAIAMLIKICSAGSTYREWLNAIDFAEQALNEIS
jgi:hypothetical protein